MVPAPLPDLDALDPEALKALVMAKHSESLQQQQQLTSHAQEIEHLKLVIEKYRRMVFGRKSEKLSLSEKTRSLAVALRMRGAAYVARAGRLECQLF
jgi:hypothetical protein